LRRVWVGTHQKLRPEQTHGGRKDGQADANPLKLNYERRMGGRKGRGETQKISACEISESDDMKTRTV